MDNPGYVPHPTENGDEGSDRLRQGLPASTVHGLENKTETPAPRASANGEKPGTAASPAARNPQSSPVRRRQHDASQSSAAHARRDGAGTVGDDSSRRRRTGQVKSSNGMNDPADAKSNMDVNSDENHNSERQLPMAGVNYGGTQIGGEVTKKIPVQLQKDTSTPIMVEGREKVVLKRRLGLFGGVALIVGSIIGSGIFVSPGKLLGRAGSVSAGLIIWVACGLLSLLGALAYAELGAIIPRNGGEYVYFYESMKDLHPFLGPLPGFLFIWVNTFLLKPSSLAILTLTFSRYLLTPIWDNLVHLDLTSEQGQESDKWATRLVAASCACFITFINCYNVKLAARVQIVFTSAKVASMAFLILGGIVMVAKGSSQVNISLDFNETASFGKLANAFYGGLWAYDGWNQLNFVTEELENPYVNLPRAIIIAMPLCIVCYVLVNIAYLSVMTAEEIISSSAVAVDFGERVLGKNFVWLMPLMVAVSTFGAANGSDFAAGRLPYSAAKEGQMPEFLGYVNVKSLSPTPALILNAVLGIGMILAGDISQLIDFFSFTAWIFYGGAMLALILMRWTRKDAHRAYKVNIAVPIFVALLSVYLVVGPIIDDPQVEYLYALSFILAGLLIYTPLIYYKLSVPGMRWLTHFVQKVMAVVPTDKEENPPTT